MASPQQGDAAAASPSSDVAAELKNYTLLERIGHNELASIFRAQHQTLDQVVHVHILRRPGWIAISRFQLAAKLQARLVHPHILRVIDAGHDETYGYYLVTPAVEAQPLQALLDEGSFDPQLAFRIFTQVGHALDFLHGQGIIHRDVQPQTILVLPNGDALLSGFSLAWVNDGPDLSQLDEVDYLTPYAAPEQTFEERTPAPALDIYALGAVLEHMLTGGLPAAAGGPPSVTERDERLQPADRIIRRMVSPQPQLRYPNAAQAIAALRGALRPTFGDLFTGTSLAEAAYETNWLENPLEVLLADRLDASYVERSQERADSLHAGDTVCRLLDTWSAERPYRRHQLGQTIRVEQVVSYNVYFYDLKVLYETRTFPETHESPHSGSRISSSAPEPDRWQVEAPLPPEPFADIPMQEIPLPHSERSLQCPLCYGRTTISCERCSGRGTVDVRRTVKSETGNRLETQAIECSACGGSGNITCTRCEGTGGLMEHKTFTFGRRGRLWQNTDDLEGLSQRAIELRSERVFFGDVNVHEPIWYGVPPLHELFQEATALEQEDTRIVTAELTIRAAPITEVDYMLRGIPRTLSIAGFDNTVRGDLSLFDSERLLIAASTVLVIVLAIVVFLALR